MVKRVKTVQESDLRMLGSLARNIQRVLPVTQADIDAAAALGKGWVVWKVFEVSDPLDNLRGGTQLVIRQNSIQPGQNVRRVIFVVGPGGQTVVIRGTDYIVLPDAIANSLSYVKAFGGTEQRNIPQPYTQVNYVTNTAQTAVNTGIMIDFAKNYEFEIECRATTSSWYILQSRETAESNVTGISGSTSGNTITLVVGNVTACTSAITRTAGNKLYVKATLNNGTATLYVKDETAGTEDTKTASYGVSQPNPPTPVYLLGNAGGNYAQINSDIYMARIKENDTVVMDYVPARQVATAGFYDTVSGTFKTALTPANLSADGNTVPAPDAPMDIVSNNGVLKVSPNLFNENTVTYGYFYNDSGVYSSNVSTYTSDKILVNPGTTVTFSRERAIAGVYLRIHAFDSNNNWISMVAKSDATTSLSVTGTTPNNTAYIRVCGGKQIEADVIDPETQVELGPTATPYIPYRQIYADGTVETINVHSKNLFDKASIEPNRIINASTGDATPSSGKYSSDYIIVKPNTTYSCNGFDDTSGINGVAFYDSNKDFVSGMSYSGAIVNNKRITVPNNSSIKYMRFGSYNITSPDDCMLVEGLTLPTTYIPYYNGGTATAEMLLKVGDYQDEQEILSGAVTRNVGVKVLDGTENVGTSNATFTIAIADRVASKTPLVCSHFQYSNKTSSQTEDLTVISFSSTNIGFRYDACANATAFKTWLANQYAAGTPVIVVYQLAPEPTDSVTGQTLQVTDGDNVLEITQASLTGLGLEAQYNAAVSLTIQEVEDANLDPNVQVTIN